MCVLRGPEADIPEILEIVPSRWDPTHSVLFPARYSYFLFVTVTAAWLREPHCVGGRHWPVAGRRVWWGTAGGCTGVGGGEGLPADGSGRLSMLVVQRPRTRLIHVQGPRVREVRAEESCTRTARLQDPVGHSLTFHTFLAAGGF